MTSTITLACAVRIVVQGVDIVNKVNRVDEVERVDRLPQPPASASQGRGFVRFSLPLYRHCEEARRRNLNDLMETNQGLLQPRASASQRT